MCGEFRTHETLQKNFESFLEFAKLFEISHNRKDTHAQMMMNLSIHSLFVILALSLLSHMVRSHSQPSLREDCNCVAGEHEFESFHIHVLFYPDGITQFQNNTHSSKYARALRKKFVDHFGAPECASPHIFNESDLCVFPVDSTGAGGEANAAPFVLPNFAIYVPVNRYVDAVPWMMANRGDLDFLVHPNTCGFTCSPEDHLLWSVWGGTKGQVRFQIPRVE